MSMEMPSDIAERKVCNMKKTMTISLLFMILLLPLLTGCVFHSTPNSAENIPNPSFRNIPVNEKPSYSYSEDGKACGELPGDKKYLYYYMKDEHENCIFYRINKKSEAIEEIFTIPFQLWHGRRSAVVHGDLAVYGEYILFDHNFEDGTYKVQKNGKGLAPVYQNKNLWMSLNISDEKAVVMKKTNQTTKDEYGDEVSVWEYYLIPARQAIKGKEPSRKEKLPAPPKDISLSFPGNNPYGYSSAYINVNGGLYLNYYMPNQPDSVLYLNQNTRIDYQDSYGYLVTHRYIFYVVREDSGEKRYVIRRCDLLGENEKTICQIPDNIGSFCFIDYDEDSVYIETNPYPEESGPENEGIGMKERAVSRLSFDGEILKKYDGNTEIGKRIKWQVVGDSLMAYNTAEDSGDIIAESVYFEKLQP